jgi:hypothetical protein
MWTIFCLLIITFLSTHPRPPDDMITYNIHHHRPDDSYFGPHCHPSSVHSILSRGRNNAPKDFLEGSVRALIVAQVSKLLIPSPNSIITNLNRT